MMIANLKSQLSLQFNLICFEDLANVKQKHRAIFDLFKLHRKDRFEDNDRLVLYSAYEPEQDFLDHIQRAAARIDISNCFIMIVCPHDITASLIRSNGKFGYDDSVIRSIVISLNQTKPFNTTQGFAKIDTLCPLPFGQLHVDATGAVKPCCKFNGIIGNSQHTPLAEIFSSDRLAAIRNQMIAGQQPSECSRCWHNESSSTTSHRQLALQKYGDLLDQVWLDDVQIRDLTLSPSSLCNFTCRICRPESSTAIAVEEMRWCVDNDQKKYFKNLIRDSNSPEKIIPMMTSPEQFSHLDFLHILGGEPFLWPPLWDMLDYIIRQGRSNLIGIEFNTNGSIYPASQIQHIVKNFKSVQILLSIDNVGSRFEIERGGRWSEILENIKKFAHLISSTVSVKLHPTVNLQNVLYLDDVVHLAESLNLDIVYGYLEKPKFLCIDNATEQTKHLVFSKYSNHPESELRKIAHRIISSSGSDGSEFLEYCHTIDQRRSQSFANSHQEIYESMGGRI